MADNGMFYFQSDYPVAQVPNQASVGPVETDLSTHIGLPTLRRLIGLSAYRPIGPPTCLPVQFV